MVSSTPTRRRRRPVRAAIIALCAVAVLSIAALAAIPMIRMPQFAGRVTFRGMNAAEDRGPHARGWMHATRDREVPFVNLERLRAAAPDADITAFVREGDMHMIVEGCDHPENDAEYAQAVLTSLDALGRE